MQEREGGAALAPGHAVLVVGAGAMGRGIALVAASAGHLVFLSDVSEEARRRALTAIAEELDGGVRKGFQLFVKYLPIVARLYKL